MGAVRVGVWHIVGVISSFSVLLSDIQGSMRPMCQRVGLPGKTTKQATEALQIN